MYPSKRKRKGQKTGKEKAFEKTRPKRATGIATSVCGNSHSQEAGTGMESGDSIKVEKRLSKKVDQWPVGGEKCIKNDEVSPCRAKGRE